MSKHTFLVSDETVNDHGFKVLTEGIDTTRFEQNPIMLYMHERARIIGKWENLRKENGQLFADAVFDLADPYANEIAGKVERGFLKGASVGLGKCLDDNGTITKCELYEISIVDIGSNTNAVRLYKDTSENINLMLNEISITESLTKQLGLFEKGETYTQAKETILAIVELASSQQKELETIKERQNQEAIFLVDEAIKRGFIKESFRDMHLKEFETDFEKSRLEIANLFPFKRLSLLELISHADKNRQQAGRDKWTLDDYRKLAPKELEANPELFQTLVNKQFNQ